MRHWLSHPRAQTSVVAFAVLVWVAAVAARVAWETPAPKAVRIGREFYFTELAVGVGGVFVGAWLLSLLVVLVAALALVVGPRTARYSVALVIALAYTVGAPLALRSGAF
jgi:hypothetical protein